MEFDDHPLRLGILVGDVPDGEVDVAFAAIEFGEQFLVVLELVLLEDATAGQPRERPTIACLEDFAQLLLAEMLRAVEINPSDLDLRCLDDFKGHCSAAGLFNDAQVVFYIRFLVAGFLIQLADRLGVGEELPFVERLTDLRRDLLLELAVAVLVVAFDANVGEQGFSLHDIHQFDSGLEALLGDADVVEITGAVKIADVVVHAG